MRANYSLDLNSLVFSVSNFEFSYCNRLMNSWNHIKRRITSYLDCFDSLGTLAKLAELLRLNVLQDLDAWSSAKFVCKCASWEAARAKRVLALIFFVVKLPDILHFWNGTESCLRALSEGCGRLVAIWIRAAEAVSRFVHFYEINLNSKVSHLRSGESQQLQHFANPPLKAHYDQRYTPHQQQTYNSPTTNPL